MAIVVANTTNVMDAEKDMFAGGKIVAQKKNRIQVSNTKKPLFFYLNLAKRYIKQYNDVELSALGMAIPTVVTIAEILKSNGLAIEKRVATSTVGSKDDAKGRLVQKAKIEIVLEKTEKDTEKEEKETSTVVTEAKEAVDDKE
uniref:DNA/RNA-binding protein Alba-like domain-containing protein n=1 Tax=Davidia involucrata TaxID=16924 RepID=A0A5B7BXD9_DAVIN